MLVAQSVNDQGQPVLVNLHTYQHSRQDKVALRERLRGREYACPHCGQAMTPNLGSLRVWHFSHQREASTCPYETQAEPESPKHRNLKSALAQAMMGYFADRKPRVELEVRLPDIGRIADVLVSLEDGSRIAVEGQLAFIPLEELMERTRSYERADIEVIWAFEARATQGGRFADHRDWLLERAHFVIEVSTQVHSETVSLGTFQV